MKKINFKSFLYLALAAGIGAGCADEPEIPAFSDILSQENFNAGSDNVIIGLDAAAPYEGWVNFAEQGTAKWKIQQFSGNGYAEYTSFQTSAPVSIGWLISPAISVEENDSKKVQFAISQSFVTSTDNKFEVFVSSDFDGTNITDATWIEMDVNVPFGTPNFEFQSGGIIDLSGFTGNVHVAFKVTGSGSNTALDGSYQIDDFTITN
ncbi:MAG TPA: choice-of-anchor J domain-containing protein [Flavobacterium sp.]|jgi:hypothetical protein